MEPLLTSGEMRNSDLYTIDKIGIPAIVLMEHAALAVVEALQERFGGLLPATKGVVFAGSGNNGADSIAVARILKEKGVHGVSIVLTKSKESLSPLCKEQLGIALKVGIEVKKDLSSQHLESCDWILDGLYGIGLNKPLGQKDITLIENINKYAGRKWIVAVDIPSGLSADTGRALPIAVQASQTVSFGFYKRGLVTGEASNFVGRLSLADIQIPRRLGEKAGALLYTLQDAKAINPRPKASHKGQFGHVYVWAGEEEKEGASVIASLGAARAGAGLVTVLGRSSIRQRLFPECMVEEFRKDLLKEEKNQIFVLGPGMGMGEKTWEVVREFLSSKVSVVLDADALNSMSEHSKEAITLLSERQKAGAITVLTPHPKEAGRLLGCEVKDIERDRYEKIQELCEKFPATILLKGHGTLIKERKAPTFVVNQGDSGLAKGGTGDLLSGIIAGILAQGIKAQDAVAFSCFVHGRSSETVTQKFGSERTTLATDLAHCLKYVFEELSV